MNPGDRVARANKALEVLDENLMGGVFRDVREALVQKLESTAIGDSSTQHEIALTLQLLKQLRQHLESYITDGKLAEREIEESRWIDKIRSKRA